jgi:hypothetical protein
MLSLRACAATAHAKLRIDSMSTHMQARAQNAAPAPFKSAPSVLLQRKRFCGGTPYPTGECEACRRRRLDLQRHTSPAAEASVVPPIVHEVLRSPGKPLDTETRAFMESRFGHDFGQVRVHTDVRAAKSARTVSAIAYTMKHNIAFSTGSYSPSTPTGKHLLAHELAHVVQQTGRARQGEAHTVLEQQAEAAAEPLSA